MPGYGLSDNRRWDFSILDDEVCDRESLTPAARAAYWSIVRHARLTGQTDALPSLLSKRAGIKKRATWRRARRELVDASLISIKMRKGLSPVISLLQVTKARDLAPIGTTPTKAPGPISAPHLAPIGTTTRPQLGPPLISETGETRKEHPAPSAGGGQTRKQSRYEAERRWNSLCPAFFKEHGRVPENAQELNDWAAGRGL